MKRQTLLDNRVLSCQAHLKSVRREILVNLPE